MYVIARLQQVDKAFFRAVSEVQARDSGSGINNGICNSDINVGGIGGSGPDSMGGNFILEHFRKMILKKLETIDETTETPTSNQTFQIFSHRRDSVPINYNF
jgi:hypothetical protein